MSTTRSVRTAVWGIGHRQSSRKISAAGVVEKKQIGKLKQRVSRFAWKSRKRRGIPTFPQPRLLLVYVPPDFVVSSVRTLGVGQNRIYLALPNIGRSNHARPLFPRSPMRFLRSHWDPARRARTCRSDARCSVGLNRSSTPFQNLLRPISAHVVMHPSGLDHVNFGNLSLDDMKYPEIKTSA